MAGHEEAGVVMELINTLSTFVLQAPSARVAEIVEVVEETPKISATKVNEGTDQQQRQESSAYILQGTASEISALLESESPGSTIQSVTSLRQLSSTQLQASASLQQSETGQSQVSPSVASVLSDAQGTVSVILVPQSQSREQNKSILKRAGEMLMAAGTSLNQVVHLVLGK